MKAGDCKHFTGIQHPTCAAGVRYLDVRDSSCKGPYRWPCLTTTLAKGPCATTCAKFEAMTAEEEAVEDAKIESVLAAIRKGRSPCCKAALDVSRVHDGVGPRFCSACQALVFRGCRPSEGASK